MTSVVIVTEMPERFQKLAEILTEEIGADIMWVETAANAISAAENRKPQLAVVDSEIGKEDGISLVRKMLGVNAWLHTALVSGLSEKEFHHRSEGLGVLVQLPPTPDQEATQGLIDALKSVGVVTSS